MAGNYLLFLLKSEMKRTAKALVSIGLLSIPFFLYSLPTPGLTTETLLPGIMMIAFTSAALGAGIKSMYFIIHHKFPTPCLSLKNAGYFFPIYLFLGNTLFTMLLYTLFCNTFLNLTAIFSGLGLTGLANRIVISGIPGFLLGLTADDVRVFAANLVNVILKTKDNK